MRMEVGGWGGRGRWRGRLKCVGGRGGRTTESEGGGVAITHYYYYLHITFRFLTLFVKNRELTILMVLGILSMKDEAKADAVHTVNRKLTMAVVQGMLSMKEAASADVIHTLSKMTLTEN